MRSITEARQAADNGDLPKALVLLTALRKEAESRGRTGALAVILNDLGGVYHGLGRYSDAEKTYEAAVRALDEHGGDKHPLMSRLLDSLASLYMDFGARYTRAERLRRRALELRVAEVGPDGPGVGVLLSNLAAACMALRRFDEASRLFDRALEVLGRNEYGQDPAVASVLQNLGALAGAMGRHTDAEHYLMRSVAVLEKAQGVDHPDLVRPLVNLSSVRLLRKDFSAAEAALLRAHRIVETRLGAEHPLMIGVLMIYQDLLRRTKQKAEADEVKRRISALMDLHPDVRAANVKVDVLDLARVAEPRGKPSTKR